MILSLDPCFRYGGTNREESERTEAVPILLFGNSIIFETFDDAKNAGENGASILRKP